MNENNFSEIFEKLNIDNNAISPDMINNLMGMLNNNNSNSSESNDSASTNTSSDSNTTSNIDMETLLKMKSIIDKMNSNQNDPRSNLLLSLKPYLKGSRQSKVDQYIQLLNMSKVLDVFPFMGGDKKNDGGA